MLGLSWAIAGNPQVFDRVTWNIRRAQSRPLNDGADKITVFFSIQNEGLEDEAVLLLWIELGSASVDITDSQDD